MVDVAEPVEVAPAHLHAVARPRSRSCGGVSSQPRRCRAPRAAAASRAPGRARRRRGRARSRCRPASARWSRSRRRPAPRPRSWSPSRRTGPSPSSAVSSIAVGSQPVALTTTTVRSAGGAPAARDRLDRRERVAQVGGDADVAEPERRDPLDRLGVDVDRDQGRRRPRGPPPAPACPRGRRRARRRCRLRRQRRASARPRRRRRRPRAPSPAAGRRGSAPTPRARTRRRCPRPRPGASRGRDAVTASRRSGVSVSEPSVATRSPSARRRGEALADGRDRAEQDAAGVGLRVVHLAPRRDDLEDPRRHPLRVAARALADVAVRGRVEAEPLDRHLELVGPHRGPGSRRSAGCGSAPRGSSTRSAPSCAVISTAVSVFMNDR